MIVRIVAAVVVLTLAIVTSGAPAAETDVFRRDNLVAWCIVPFDAAKRSPEQRAAMLDELGIHQLAYDWRADHVPEFDEEVAAMGRHGVRIVAWWLAPADLNETHRKILDVVARHKLKLQFWTLAGDPDAKLAQADKVKSVAAQIRPLADAAAKLGCQVGLYNHGGWFGEPENQLAVLNELALDNVGIVYNLHHGHGHLDRLPALLEKLKPHLYAININGMTRRGDEIGKKILPIGTGDLDLGILKTIRASGYQGPIGILNHTDLDARARLADNLAGLDWLTKQLDGAPAGPRPKLQTYADEQAPPAVPPASGDQSRAERELVSDLIAAARDHGDARRGAAVFASQKFACVSCHRVGEQGSAVGPELTDAGKRLCPEELVESLLWPKRKVRPEFVALAIATDDGTIRQGYVKAEADGKLTLLETATGQTVDIRLDEIIERQEIGTLMPEGLASGMSPEERRDVVRFLMQLGQPEGERFERILATSHAPATFAYKAAPLVPAEWRFAGHAVNRDRVYDFYAKEADYFRDVDQLAAILPEYPGLDGGTLGHWGNQNEDTWRSEAWNRMDVGSVMCGVVGAGPTTIARGVCARLAGISICFNPDTLNYEAAWRGGFVAFSPVRSGFVDPIAAAGEAVAVNPAQRPAGAARYRGYYRHGDKVVFAYEIDGRLYLDAPRADAGRFANTIAPADEHPLREALQGGPAQWPQTIETRGRLGTGGAYVIDTIELPTVNPWSSLMYFGGHDFLPDGSAMLCTMQGDVWHVAGLDDKLERVRWKRFAAGLAQPQGLVVADGAVYVLGRNQITRLRDLNGDDEADFYECFSKAYETSAGGHDFICGLERDAEGNFYTASGNQGLLKISADGQSAHVLATGFRNPDGLGLLPDGALTVPCSEGEWTATSMIDLVRPALERGEPPHFGYRGPRRGERPELPLVYLPRGLDNSSGGQTFVTSQKFGPLVDQIVHFSFGAGTWFVVLRDEVAGQPQGAVVPLRGDFSSGPHRGRFSPIDGQLYVTGMGGWGTYTPETGCFERVRYTGADVQLPIGFHAHKNGIRVTFARPIDSSIASQAVRQFAQAWNYRYRQAYGSPELAPSHPNLPGHDRLAVAGSHALADGRSLFLELPDLQPVNQLHLRLQVDDTRPVELYATIHAHDEPFTQFEGYQPREKTIAAHPLLADMMLLSRPPLPNPFGAELADAREIRLEAGKNLSYLTRSIAAKPGERIKLSFVNPDTVPHNWVLVKPGSLNRIGDLVNKLVADPEAAYRSYVPNSPDVLAYTDIVTPGGEFAIYFTAPSEPGRYPYLCSFPGHWMAMNGQLVVE